MQDIFSSITEKVSRGDRFSADFSAKTVKVNGKPVDLKAHLDELRYDTSEEALDKLEELFETYYHSVPSERSESTRKRYFKALPEKELSDDDMLYGERREEARARLETAFLILVLNGSLTWDPAWGSWFWKSPHNPDMVILREWIEPQN